MKLTNVISVDFGFKVSLGALTEEEVAERVSKLKQPKKAAKKKEPEIAELFAKTEWAEEPAPWDIEDNDAEIREKLKRLREISKALKETNNT